LPVRDKIIFNINSNKISPIWAVFDLVISIILEYNVIVKGIWLKY
jgi:hypothetical protein